MLCVTNEASKERKMSSSTEWKRPVSSICSVVLLLGMVAYGTGVRNIAASSKVAVPAAAACGALSFKAPNDPQHALRGMPPIVLDAYSHYVPVVYQSAYLNFRPKHKAPWAIGYSDSFSGNFWRADALAKLRANVAAFQKMGLVKKLIYTDSNLKNDVQIQQMRSMIQQHVDIILSIPNSATAFNGVIREAYNAGIPVITFDAPVTSPYAINVDNNNYLTDAKVAKGMVSLLGGKGNVVVVDGLPGAPGSIQAHQGTYDVFHTCPGIKIVGNYAGNWNEPDSKSNTLKFLATHPGKIDGFETQGGESLAVIQALQQTGRPIGIIGDGNPDKGSLAAFRKFVPSRYAASVNPPIVGMDAVFRVAMHVLRGEGLKASAIVANPPLAMGASLLKRWVNPAWTETTPGQSPAPPGTRWLDEGILKYYFKTYRPLP
jgi:ribose transport system substrate-binding protein